MKQVSYVGSSQGENGPIKVEVTFSKNKIESVQMVSQKDDLDYTTKAVEGMPEIIIEKQRLDVDAVFGATLTSRGIIGAVAQCVTDAGADPQKLGFTSVAKKTDSLEVLITGLDDEKIITGENAPMFIGPDLPEGMRMKDMLYNKLGKDLLLSVLKAQEKYGTTTMNGKSGVAIDKIFQELKIKKATRYKLTGSDGNDTEISLEELKNGILTLSDGGVDGVFEGPDAVSVKGLLFIKAAV